MAPAPTLASLLPFVADPATKAATLLILIAMYAQAGYPVEWTEPTASEQPVAAKYSGPGGPLMFNLSSVVPSQIAAASAVAQVPGVYEDEVGRLKLPYYGGEIPFRRDS